MASDEGKPMKKLLITIALASSAGLALAHNCPAEMKAIDAKLATAKLSDADAAKVKKLRADGETAHKAGKHDDSMKALGEAKKTLGI
jgi:Ni/Co efflux regulator RcnB